MCGASVKPTVISSMRVSHIATVGSAVAALTPVHEVALEKRVTHTGRVSSARSHYILNGLLLTHTLQGTFFHVGLGACGKINKDSDHIVAISSSRFRGGENCDQVSKYDVDLDFGEFAHGGFP